MAKYNDLDKEKLFAIAEQVTGKDRYFFASKLGVSFQMIDYVIRGQRKSKRIEKEIDAHIKRALSHLKIYLEAA